MQSSKLEAQKKPTEKFDLRKTIASRSLSAASCTTRRSSQAKMTVESNFYVPGSGSFVALGHAHSPWKLQYQRNIGRSGDLASANGTISGPLPFLRERQVAR